MNFTKTAQIIAATAFVVVCTWINGLITTAFVGVFIVPAMVLYFANFPDLSKKIFGWLNNAFTQVSTNLNNLRDS